MKAVAVFPKTQEIKVIDHPEPAIETPTQVKLQMLDVGVCGTDKEICHFDYGTPPDGSDYLIVGHESLGKVVEIGAEVKSLKTGDLVVVMVRRPCDDPNCVACRAGRQDFCLTGNYRERGIKQLHGFMSEFVVDEEKYMLQVPQEIRNTAVLTEPLTIAEKALTEMWSIQKRLPWGSSVEAGKARGYNLDALVLGAGPVGLLGAMTLRSEGFRTHVYSLEEEPNPKSDVVKSIGANYYSAKTHSLDQVAEAIGNIDVIFEATGASSLAFSAMKILGVNGVFIFTGVPGRKGPIEVNTDLIMRDLVLKNQVALGSVNAAAHAFKAAIADLAQFQKLWPQATRALITGHYPMTDFKKLATEGEGGIKNVIEISQDDS